MKVRLYFAVTSLACCLFFEAGVTQAHVTGASWEKIVNQYKIDVGYDPVTIVANQSQRFDFNVLNASNTQAVNFSDVWVRISRDQDTIFATGIHKPSFGLAGMIFVFPEPGDYSLDVRFENNDSSIVETSLPVSVVPSSDQASVKTASKLPLFTIGSGILGFLLGCAVLFAATRKKKRTLQS